MTSYLVRRFLIAIPILLGVSLVTFAFANFAPGDPLSALARPGSHVRPQDIEALRVALGLDKPWPQRYVTWLSQVLQGNLGISFVSNLPVADTLGARLPNTVLLMGTALLVSLVLGIMLGVFSAFRAGTRLDKLMTVVVFAGISLPSYLVALLVVLAFAVLPYALAGIRLFPATGIRDPLGTSPPLIDTIHHLILPASVLAFGGTATFMRFTRASVLEVMRQEYVTTAHSKGLAERTVRWRHVLRNALLPVVTVLGLSIPSLITGALFVETLFSWPGLGSLAVEATLRRDYTVIMGIGLVTSVVIVFSNLATDMAYAFVDPRIRHS